MSDTEQPATADSDETREYGFKQHRAFLLVGTVLLFGGWMMLNEPMRARFAQPEGIFGVLVPFAAIYVTTYALRKDYRP